MNPPLLHVLIINWNGMAHLDDCFQSLLRSDYPNARFILVDNGSNDGSIQHVQARYGADSRVEILALPKNLGWSGGNNAGMEQALARGADYVFLINNDTRIASDCLSRCVALAESAPDIGAVAPKMVLFDQPFVLNSVGLVCSVIASCWDLGVGRVDAPQWNRSQEVIGACGGACLIRTGALRKTGLLPKSFHIYLDDLDLCLRLWDAGYRILSCPDAVVEHKFSASMGEGARARLKYYLGTRNRFQILLRNFPVRTMIANLPLVALGEIRALGSAMRASDYWKIWMHLKAWGAALASLPAAWNHRRLMDRNGLARGRFAKFLVKRPLFCPKRDIPVNGCYAPVSWQGGEVTPVSVRAWMDLPPGQLRLSIVNCYPRLGGIRMRVFVNGLLADTLETHGADTAEWAFPGGRLLFESERIFTCEDTQDSADYGGWILVKQTLLHEKTMTAFHLNGTYHHVG